jgi:integrase
MQLPHSKSYILFSCLTGLRKSDIEKLTWGEIQKFGDFTRIVFKQKKTGGQEYLDISDQAAAYLGNRVTMLTVCSKDSLMVHGLHLN